MADNEIPVFLSPAHSCSYLPGRQARNRFFEAPPGCDGLYESLLSQRWRRAGRMIYQPDCPDCQLCRPIRIPVNEFKPSSSQRRTLRKNADLEISLTKRIDDPGALELYCRYQSGWHHAAEPADPEDARDFLGLSPVESSLMLYRLGPDLVGAGWIDILADGISSVYFAFDPAHAKRRLGVFSLLQEIGLARRLGKQWLYLGFWIPGCGTMQYKAEYLPHEILVDGQWRRNQTAPIPGDPGPDVATGSD